MLNHITRFLGPCFMGPCFLGLRFLGLGFLGTATLHASEELVTPSPEMAGVPFVFSSEDWGLAYGAAGIITGIGQPQMSLFGTVIGSDNGTLMGYVGLYNLMIPGADQLLFDLNIWKADFTETNYYQAGNTQFPGEQSGSNDSSFDNYIRTGAREQDIKLSAKYVLPIGAGTDGALPSIMKRNSGYDAAGIIWNPRLSGITTLEIQPFYQSQELEKYKSESVSDHVAGARFILEYDNRNSSHLPTHGSNTILTYTRDWGSSNRPEWSTIELEFSQFFDLGSNDYMNQRVIGFNAWIADTPTWNDSTDINGERQFNRAPSYAGITLGGWDKLRGYSSQRFSGRSAISYSLEYRMMPSWQPLENMPVLGPLYEMPWWQWTLFADAGRVSDQFNLSELHDDMKLSVGGGIRFKVEGVTVRTEVASGSEDWYFRVFVNQPF